ncbi:DUF334 domain-containing protein [Macrococcus equipercicus]|uniref:DUF334 domain-containing protein n=1 Tax=Macrococcus equipercicus TaxID=69967 RepID=A0ABQ6R629_9STAP|nr:DUF334 domain-containing protein [Macrococcus equipercicus]
MLELEETQALRNQKIDRLITALSETTTSLKGNADVLDQHTKVMAQNKTVEMVLDDRLTQAVIETVDENLKEHVTGKMATHLNHVRMSSLHSVEKLDAFNKKMERTNKFFYPTLYGVFIAFISFIFLFLTQIFTTNMLGDSYYLMIAKKIEHSTGFNTFIWYLAYLTPVLLVVGMLYVIFRWLFKKREDYYR